MNTIASYKLEKEKTLPIVTVAAAIALLYTTFKMFGSRNKKNKNDIPTPPSSYPYVGHMLSLGELPSKTVSDWHKELGPIIKINMGAETWVSINCPRMAHQLLVVNGAKTSHRQRSYFLNLYTVGGKGVVFSEPNNTWKKVRAAVLSAISPSQINIYLESIEQEASELTDRLIEASKNQNGVYPYKELQLYTMNTIFLICFGKKFKSSKEPDFQLATDLIEKGMKFSGMEYDLATYLPIFSIYDYFFTGNHSEMKKEVKEGRDPFYRQMVKEASDEGSRYNLVKNFKENGFSLSEEEMVVTTSDLVGAGTDTIAVTFTWIILTMCHHPQVQLKVQEEIDRFIEINKKLPTVNDKEQLPYCFSVIKECMRYKPATAFGVPHIVNKDVLIDGYVIEKGTTIITSNVSLHTNPEFYPNTPERFLPERFMDNLKPMQASVNGKLEARDHFAFGWGRRICPGINLAEAEIFSAFVKILSKCSIEPEDNGMPNISEAVNCGLTLLPIPFKVKFLERKQ